MFERTICGHRAMIWRYRRMRLGARKTSLALAALSMFWAMLTIVPGITQQLSPLTGHVSVLAIYWVCFCIPVWLIFGRGTTDVSIQPEMTKSWVPAVALALPVIIFLSAQTWSAIQSEAGIVAIAILCALINGPLEELAWRRTFRANSDGQMSFELIGLGLFTLWHVPLYFSNGVTFDQGAFGLVGGAFFLGTVWMFMTRASNSVGWPMISHALVNVAAFLPFFEANFG